MTNLATPTLPGRRLSASCELVLQQLVGADMASTVGERRMGRMRRLRPVEDMTALDDHALLTRLDEPDAMVELVNRHQRSLLSMAMTMIRNRPDAEEIVQDTFVQAYRAAPSFRGDAKVSTWLHSICYRQVLTRTRRKRHLTVALDTATEPAAVSSDDAFRLDLQTALDQLPEHNRQAFILVDILGFTRAEAADIAGTEANTMRARVARARDLLADTLTTKTPS